MEDKMKCTMVDKKDGLNLDPRLWKELPEELLAWVIAKLPFARMVAFRLVCKHWHSEIIPRAARHFEKSSRSAVLYFGFLEAHHERLEGWKNKDSKVSPWWLQVCNSQNECSDSVEEFWQKSFPSPRNEEEVQLMICEQGLLFFGFVYEGERKKMVRDIVVCNPLLSQSRSLGLPCPLGPASMDEQYWDLFVGAAFDSKTGSYCLVAAGVDAMGQYATYSFDSSTSAWTKSSSQLPAVLEVGEGVLQLNTWFNRSVCCNGNLYWHVYTSLSNLQRRHYVLKFDIQHDRWTLIPDPVADCSSAIGGCQIAVYREEIILWHLHTSPRNPNLRCRSNLTLELAPEIRFLQHDMGEKVDGFLIEEGGWGLDECFEYFAFSQQNFIYHVVPKRRIDSYEEWLRIVVQDTKDNSYTELPILQTGHMFSDFSPRNLWSFSASLRSLP